MEASVMGLGVQTGSSVNMLEAELNKHHLRCIGQCFISPHRFAVIIVDIVRIWDKQEAVPPFLALL